MYFYLIFHLADLQSGFILKKIVKLKGKICKIGINASIYYFFVSSS